MELLIPSQNKAAVQLIMHLLIADGIKINMNKIINKHILKIKLHHKPSLCLLMWDSVSEKFP